MTNSGRAVLDVILGSMVLLVTGCAVTPRGGVNDSGAPDSAQIDGGEPVTSDSGVDGATSDAGPDGGPVAPPTCGNGVIDPGEICDPGPKTGPCWDDDPDTACYRGWLDGSCIACVATDWGSCDGRVCRPDGFGGAWFYSTPVGVRDTESAEWICTVPARAIPDTAWTDVASYNAFLAWIRSQSSSRMVLIGAQWSLATMTTYRLPSYLPNALPPVTTYYDPTGMAYWVALDPATGRVSWATRLEPINTAKVCHRTAASAVW